MTQIRDIDFIFLRLYVLSVFFCSAMEPYHPYQSRPSPAPMKPYAGQYTDLSVPRQQSEAEPQPYRSSDGIIGFSGYLPGLQHTIGASYPKMAKMSRSYVESKEAGKDAADPPKKNENVDKWGNFVPSKSNSRALAGLYLEALYDGGDRGKAVASQPQAGALPAPAKHTSGYTGYRPGASKYFAESYNRVETKLGGGGTGTNYETINFSPTRHRGM